MPTFPINAQRFLTSIQFKRRWKSPLEQTKIEGEIIWHKSDSSVIHVGLEIDEPTGEVSKIILTAFADRFEQYQAEVNEIMEVIYPLVTADDGKIEDLTVEIGTCMESPTVIISRIDP